jgi:hypothetical protein
LGEGRRTAGGQSAHRGAASFPLHKKSFPQTAMAPLLVDRFTKSFTEQKNAKVGL